MGIVGSESVWCTRPITDGPPPRLEVLHRDANCVIVNKPAGIATMPRGSYIARSAVVAARSQFTNCDIIAAHRLDRLTSGALLLVTNRQSRGAYQQLFARGEVEKTYWAITAAPTGPLPGKLGAGERCEIRLALARQTTDLRIGVDPGGRVTRTRIQLRYTGARTWWWQVQPLTGHQHQIRVVFNHLGIPIMYDPLYPRTQPRYAPSWQRGLALHAAELKYRDPLTGALVSTRAPLPGALSEIAGAAAVESARQIGATSPQDPVIGVG